MKLKLDGLILTDEQKATLQKLSDSEPWLDEDRRPALIVDDPNKGFTKENTKVVIARFARLLTEVSPEHADLVIILETPVSPKAH